MSVLAISVENLPLSPKDRDSSRLYLFCSSAHSPSLLAREGSLWTQWQRGFSATSVAPHRWHHRTTQFLYVVEESLRPDEKVISLACWYSMWVLIFPPCIHCPASVVLLIGLLLVPRGGMSPVGLPSLPRWEIQHAGPGSPLAVGWWVVRSRHYVFPSVLGSLTSSPSSFHHSEFSFAGCCIIFRVYCCTWWREAGRN